ncbi:hypothetical protein MRB53_038880 [Persea americana]|nr:hypothetical protein MRB53_038880 [Persea americana]
MEEAEAFSRGEVKQIEDVKDTANEHVSVSNVEKTRADAASKERVRELQTGISEAEMDEYRRQRVSKNDPMAGMLGQDGLLNEQSAVT